MNSIRNNLIIEFHIPDFQKARDFYSIFGFTQLSHDPASEDGRVLEYMVLERMDPLGRTILNFYGNKEEISRHAYFKDFPATTPRGYGVETTVPVSDVEKLWEEANSKLSSSQVARPLTLKRWNKKDFRVVDPFGFYIRFTELVDWGQ
ncbi:MAG: hypothetical protein Q7R59_02655 [bacterium]|nr:hypothetical protein [bacterium]